MTSIKCPHCGFVTSQTNANCRRCCAGLTAAAKPRTSSGSGRTKILMIGLAAGVLVVFAVLGLAILRRSATLGESDSLPITMATLLNAEGRFKSPVTVRLLSKLHDQFPKNDIDQKRFLQDYPEVSVLEQLGLVSVDNFNVIKADKYCSRNGEHEECTDVWDYSVNVRLVDPDTIDHTNLIARLQSANTTITPPIDRLPIHDQKVFMSPSGVAISLPGQGSFDTVTVPIGSFEVVEVSDVRPGPAKDNYIMCFKFRFKPNILGEVFDRAIHHSEPTAIRKIIDQPDFDDRIRFLAQHSDSEELGAGYAHLLKVEGQWVVTRIYFDNSAAADYTLHRV
jgi:hypothetical protein